MICTKTQVNISGNKMHCFAGNYMTLLFIRFVFWFGFGFLFEHDEQVVKKQFPWFTLMSLVLFWCVGIGIELKIISPIFALHALNWDQIKNSFDCWEIETEFNWNPMKIKGTYFISMQWNQNWNQNDFGPFLHSVALNWKWIVIITGCKLNRNQIKIILIVEILNWLN